MVRSRRKKISVFMLFLMVGIQLLGQDTVKNQNHRFNAVMDVGTVVLAPMDISLLSSSQLTEIDHRVVGTLGAYFRWNILKEGRLIPYVELGGHLFRSKASDLDTTYLTNTVAFRNTYISNDVALMVRSDFNYGGKRSYIHVGVSATQTFFLVPYTKDYLGVERKGFEGYHYRSVSTSIDKPGGPRYNGPFQCSAVVGFELPCKKMGFAVFYNQRLFYHGFNREISRITFRVMI